ncbi:EI24 domain-containing protein [Geminocystis sp. NIES-3709]|uniref:EI24 domain-containing protein n=1 Tax=Geminocystis sp. NIES-3709 TaxID=1617448 RepID=UPI0005FC4ABB|nr:EI24 domain-containing protein [Geminocystis sp. NIES-3709]BAQ66216.1 sulfate transporter [Geminocystis sp. NIES-3709]
MIKQIFTGFGFFTGISYPFIAIKFLAQNKQLWQYLIIPIIINFSVGIATYLLLLNPSLDLFDSVTNDIVLWVDKAIDRLPEWSNFLVYIIIFFSLLLKALLFILLLILIGFVIVQFGSILGSPWYGKLSEKLEILYTGKLEVIEINIIQDIFRAILFELKKLLLILIFSIPLFLINFIPTLGNIISLVGSITLTTTIICLDFCDATLERKRLQFREKLKFIWGKFPTTAGFGLICLTLISIPLLNLIIIPLCVSAGTLLVCDQKRNAH